VSTVKTAIALFGDEVSPRFGCAREFLLVDHEQGRCRTRTHVDVDAVAPARLAATLAEHGATEVICGGIHRRFLRDLRGRGMRVIWGVIGPYEEVLTARLADRLETNQVVADRACRRRRERRRLCGGSPRFDDSTEAERSSP
jgi:predicted Fe-Mo cluster-binding NifX family protein